MNLRTLLLTVLVAPTFFMTHEVCVAATLIVYSTADQPDTNPGDGICRGEGLLYHPSFPFSACTLRAAIMEAAANGQTDQILVRPGFYQALRGCPGRRHRPTRRGRPLPATIRPGCSVANSTRPASRAVRNRATSERWSGRICLGTDSNTDIAPVCLGLGVEISESHQRLTLSLRYLPTANLRSAEAVLGTVTVYAFQLQEVRNDSLRELGLGAAGA